MSDREDEEMSDKESGGEEEFEEDIEVEDPMEMFVNLFQSEEGENICDILASIRDLLSQQVQVQKLLVKSIREKKSA